MKRITKSMKVLDLLATLFELVLVIVGLVMFFVFFNALQLPEKMDLPVEQVEHVVMGMTIMTAEMNLIIGSLIAYLIVFIPLVFMGFKRFFDKENIEIDVWSYRNQYLLAFFDLITLNIVSAVIRFLLAQEISLTVVEHGFIESVKKTFIRMKERFVKLGQWFVILYKKTANLFLKEEKKYKFTQLSKEQEDIEKLNRSALIVKVIRLVATYTFLTLMALFIFIPFYWMIITALKDNYTLVNDMSPSFFVDPREMQWVNFKYVLEELQFGTYIKNTLFVGVTTMLGTTTITILAAFAFSRLDWKGRDFIFSILLATMMIPGELYTITNYVTVSNLGWVKTDKSFYALILPFLTSVFYIFFLRQSFKQIPDTLYRAARVDGCTDFKYLTRVMIPVAAPTIITIVILSALGAWDAYIWPQLVAGKDHWLISVALRNEGFTVGTGSDARPLTNLQVAASALVTVPLLIVFFTFKKYIVTGVGRSGTKG